jgi:8-oxo-dGTP diphosphatase
MYMKRTQIYITNKQHDLMMQVADNTGMNFSEHLRRAIDQYLINVMPIGNGYKVSFGGGKSKMKLEYVLGFCVNDAVRHKEILLIEKTKADWQEGRVNGIGGKIDHGESPETAMEREFTEETGVDGSSIGWRRFCQLTDEHGWIVHCFVGVGNLTSARDCDEGRMVHADPDELPSNVLDDKLKWLVPMALAESPVEAYVKVFD